MKDDDNKIDLGIVLNEYREEPERPLAGSKIGDFIVSLLAIVGFFFLASLIGGGIKI